MSISAIGHTEIDKLLLVPIIRNDTFLAIYCLSLWNCNQKCFELPSCLHPMNLVLMFYCVYYCVYNVSLCFVTFPCGVSDQIWYLIVSIPDFVFFFYFYIGKT